MWYHHFHLSLLMFELSPASFQQNSSIRLPGHTKSTPLNVLNLLRFLEYFLITGNLYGDTSCQF